MNYVNFKSSIQIHCSARSIIRLHNIGAIYITRICIQAFPLFSYHPEIVISHKIEKSTQQNNNLHVRLTLCYGEENCTFPERVY